MKYVSITLGLLLSLSASATSVRNEPAFKAQLVRVISELNVVTKMLDKAEAIQPKNTKYKLNISQYTDFKGVRHTGVKQDIKSIKLALIEHINKQKFAPKKIQPLAFDYEQE